MSNIKASISTTPADCLAQISAALSPKYGAAYTEYYKSATDLIFLCTAISSKVIKISYASDMDVVFYYGDAWTSGATITNSVSFLSHDTQTGAMTSINIILGDSFMMFNSLGSKISSMVAIIAKTAAGDSVVFGFQPSASPTIYGLSKNITTGEAIAILDFQTPFLGTSSKVYKSPIMIINASSNIVQMNGANPDTIADLYMSSWNLGNAANLIGSTYIITSGRLYSGSAVLRLSTGLLAEWTV